MIPGIQIDDVSPEGPEPNPNTSHEDEQASRTSSLDQQFPSSLIPIVVGEVAPDAEQPLASRPESQRQGWGTTLTIANVCVHWADVMKPVAPLPSPPASEQPVSSRSSAQGLAAQQPGMLSVDPPAPGVVSNSESAFEREIACTHLWRLSYAECRQTS